MAAPEPVLLIKHLPAELSFEDREELLKIFGAKKVRIMPDKGKFKYTAFATFNTREEAKNALSKLHQLEILNQKLVVEFAKKQQQIEFPKQSDFPEFKPPKQNEGSKAADKETLRQESSDFAKSLHGICPSLGLDYLPSPLLKYNYPPPTPSIIANISHALAAVPKFYTQVLHLMNKMNLPAPFGPVTPAAPLNPDHSVAPLQSGPLEQDYATDRIEVEEMDTSSEEESELESEDEMKEKRPDAAIPAKRPTNKVPRQRKKMKFHQMMQPVTPSTMVKSAEPHAQPSDVFELRPSTDQKKIQFNIKPTLDTEQPRPERVDEEEENICAIRIAKVDRIDKSPEKETSEQTDSYSTDYISMRELRQKRISSSEMKTLSAFKSYTPGEPSVRLYIKNLARQVEEKDLRYVFGRFIDQHSETERNMFDIRLMKEGRMKGQAFITLANEKQAIAAVKETNGFVLHTKPLVVQFARSAKPKEVPDKKLAKTS